MTERLRVAVVGAGGWGEQHARIFSRREDTELCAVAGRTPERTRARAERYGATPYTDLDLMLRHEQPDLITVCLPNEDHYDVTLKLVRAGVPLLVEKPLVFDLTEADTLLAERPATASSPSTSTTGTPNPSSGRQGADRRGRAR